LDLETSGSNYKCHRVTQIGGVAFKLQQFSLEGNGKWIFVPKILGEFEVCIKVGREHWDPKTISWFKKDPVRRKTYEKIKKQGIDAKKAVRQFVTWLKRMQRLGETGHRNLHFVYRPSQFDHPFIMRLLAQYSNFAITKSIDLSSIRTWFLMLQNFTTEQYDQFWKGLAGNEEHTHDALDDAKEQMNVFVGFMNLALNGFYAARETLDDLAGLIAKTQKIPKITLPENISTVIEVATAPSNVAKEIAEAETVQLGKPYRTIIAEEALEDVVVRNWHAVDDTIDLGNLNPLETIPECPAIEQTVPKS
jgi:hypothetical protein